MSDAVDETLDILVEFSTNIATITCVGFESLQTNTILSNIRQRFRISCHLQSQFSDVEIHDKKNTIVLIDCNRYTFSNIFTLLASRKFRSPRIIVLLFNMERNSRFDSLADNPQVKGIFYNSANFSDLLTGLEEVICGKLWLPRHLMEKIVNSHRKLPSFRIANKEFTKREQQVLHSICQGYTNQDIATELGLSEHTIKSHLYNLFKKHGFKNRLEACAWARDTIEAEGKFPESSKSTHT